MKLITIVDNNNGLSFLNKRLSRDRILYKYIDNLFTKFTVQENGLSNKQGPTFKNSTNEQTDILFVETGVNDIFNKYQIDELYLFNCVFKFSIYTFVKTFSFFLRCSNLPIVFFSDFCRSFAFIFFRLSISTNASNLVTKPASPVCSSIVK